MPTIQDYLMGGGILLVLIGAAALISWPIFMALLQGLVTTGTILYNVAYTTILLGHLVIILYAWYVTTWGVKAGAKGIFGG